jgi:Tfp pilus assembly protein PilF
MKDLGPYRLEAKLGAGGMGDVYRAVDTRLGRAVAIKIAQAPFIHRFEREARAISSLNHPHICTLYDVGPNYLVMELVEGETIAALLKRGPIPVTTALVYASQILAALREAHEQGVIHRDLKPGNIMIGRSGVKVLDFGIAKSDHDETVTASLAILGTPAYMAPEQRLGQPADARADIYSFGCVFYEMLSGARVGFERKRVASRKLESIVNRCLEEDPRRRWQTVAELAAVVAGVPTGSPSHRARTQTAKRTIVLAEFSNDTGDAFFDGGLRQILAMQLENSTTLSLLPDAQVGRALGLMGRPASSKLTPAVAMEVCERTASLAVVEGSIASLGTEYGLSVLARNCRTGEILHKEQARAAQREDVSKALATLAKRFRARAVASLPQVEAKTDLSTDITTSSLEAWRSYNTGVNISMHRGTPAETVSLLKRAVEIDPTFAMAHARLGRTYDSLGAPELAAQSIATAYELRDRVSDRENLFITFNYYRQVPRNLELARQTLESWLQKYPGELMPHGFLSGWTSPGMGHHARAVEEGQKALALDPDFSIGYYNVGFACLYLNRLAEAEALLRQASERQIENSQLSLIRYFLAFLRDDDAAMESEAAERRARLHAQGWFEHQEALTLAYHGRLKEANAMSDRAVSLARVGGQVERSALFQGARAVWSALFDSREEAQRNAVTALATYRSRDADYGPAFALALLHDATQTRTIEADLDERYPQDTSVQFSYLPALRALDALNLGDPAKALEMTHAAAPYEAAVPGTAYLTGGAFFGTLYPVYVRGLAYSAMSRHTEAVGEFQKICDHPGLVLNDPVGPMARLQLARALSASGDRVRSAAAYKELLAIWRDANPDVSIVAQARAEHSRLQ